MSWYVVLGIVSAAVGLTSVAAGILRWMHKMVVKAVVEGVAEELGDINSEVRANGGRSMKDTLNRLDKRVGEIGAGADTRFSDIDRHLVSQDRRIDRLFELLGGKR